MGNPFINEREMRPNKMMLAKYLNKHISKLLEIDPIKNWPVDRELIEYDDPPRIGYTFEGSGLQVSCDMGERIQSIFLELEMHDKFLLSEVQFTQNRTQIIKRFGTPSKSGEGISDAILGEFGPWDRFQNSEYTLHVQYTILSDGIEKITLMRNDVVPSKETILVFMPSLVATLLDAERAKGAALTEFEVLEIRDNAPVIAIEPEALPEIVSERGYEDIDPENCWKDWQEIRIGLLYEE